MSDLTTVTPTWVTPISGAEKYFVETTESESMNKEYFLISNTPSRQYELNFLGISDEQYIDLLTQYRSVSGEYAGFYWKTISPQFYSLLGTDLSLKKVDDLIGNNDLDVTGAISCKGSKDVGWGMQFDGVNDYLMPNPSSTTTIFNFDYYQNFAVAFWIKLPSAQVNLLANNNPILGKFASTSSSTYPFVFQVYNSNISYEGKILFTRRASAIQSLVRTTSLLNDNNWHHITGIRGTSSGVSLISIYVDGTLQSSAIDNSVSGGLTTNSVNLAFGTYRVNNLYNLKGSIDGVRFYDIELNAASVSLLCAGTSTLTNCIAAYDFNDVSMYGRWIGQPEVKTKARSYDMKLNFENCPV